MTYDDGDEAESPGVRVHVRTRYGWELTGELRKSGGRFIRMFDPVIGDVVRLSNDEVVEITTLEDIRAVKTE